MLTIVETERLIIRQITHEDALNLAKVLADPIVMKYSTVGVHSEEQIDAYITKCKNQYDSNGYGHWAIYTSRTNEFVGVCGLNEHKVDSDDIIHVNYRLAADQQGKGYAVESTLGVLDFAKNSLKFNAVYALIDPDNISSVKVANRAGFQFVRSSVFHGFDVDIYQATL